MHHTRPWNRRGGATWSALLLVLGIIVLCRYLATQNSTLLSGQQCAPELTASGRLIKYQETPDWIEVLGASSEDQQLFNNGLLFAWSYNQAEALRSFDLALKQAPDSSLLHWARSYALGPFANRVPHDEDPGYPAFLPKHLAAATEAAARAVDLALRRKQSLRIQATQQENDAAEVELKLAQAALQHYSPAIVQQGETGFAQRFNVAQKKYAQDLELLARTNHNAAFLAMAAEALLVPHAWAYQQDQQGQVVLSGDGASALQMVNESLQWDPHQPLALHLHIHIAEAGSPVRTSADALAVADADESAHVLHAVQGPWRQLGHLVHMPSHIHVRTGRFHEAIEANLHSLELDTVDVGDCQIQPSTEHSIDTLIYAANMAGQSELAIDWSRKKRVLPNRQAGWLEGSQTFDWTALPLTWVFQGMWEEILSDLQPPPLNARGVCAKDGFNFATAVYHFAMTMASAAHAETLRYHQEDESSAVQQALYHQQALQKTAALLPQGQATSPGQGEGLYGCEYKHLTAIQVQVAASRVAQATGSYPGNFTAAEVHMRHAVELESQLSYAMPPRQYQPLNHCLAHVLMRANKPQEAEKAAHAALKRHPNNAWGLYAMLEAVLKQNGTSHEVIGLQRDLEYAWRHADRTIRCPCPIFVIW